MSIYATLWRVAVESAELPASFRVPRHVGDGPLFPPLIEVWAQAVPAHIGHPSHYPDGDPYADVLPPITPHDEGLPHRAVVIVGPDNRKDVQRYVNPLLVLTGEEYEAIRWTDLLTRIQDAIAARDRGELAT